MNKLKQLLVGMFIASTLFVTQSVAETRSIKFDGIVTMHPDILSLLDTCNGNGCPSVQIEIQQKSQGIYNNTYASVYYNEVEDQYKYAAKLTQDIATDNNYSVTIRITNGDMGEYENLYYDFGLDKRISDDDKMLHGDEVFYSNGISNVNNIELPQEQTAILLDIDLSTKNDGRQKIVGKLRLPIDTALGDIYDESGTYVGSNYVNISIKNVVSNTTWLTTTLSQIADEDGLYPFVASLKFDPEEPLHSVLTVSGNLDGNSIAATYQIGQDEDDLNDHAIDGDEKFVSRSADLTRDYAIFSNTLADYGIIDLDAYFVGAKTLTGSVVWPTDFLVYEHDSRVTVTVESEFGVLGTAESRIYKNIDKPENVSHPFEILVPQDIQDKELFFSIYLLSTNNLSGPEGYRVTYRNAYNFGTDKQVGGSGDDLDHLNEPCEAFYNAKPLIVDYTSTLPVIDINLSTFEPVSSHAAITIIPIPVDVENLTLSLADMSCPNEPVYTPFRINEPMGDGWYMDTYDALFEGHDYALVADYTVFGEHVTYAANDNDNNFTNGGVYLDTMKWIENPNGDGNLVLDTAYISGGEGIRISPFEFIIPNKSASPAVIMYLLN